MDFTSRQIQTVDTNLDLSQLQLNSVETKTTILNIFIVIVILSCSEVVQIHVRPFPILDWIIMDMYET